MTHETRGTPYDASALGTVLTVWAHPDDEAYLAGGLLAAVRDAGNRAVCVTATRGEAADPQADAAERAALSAVSGPASWKRPSTSWASPSTTGSTSRTAAWPSWTPTGQADRLSAIVDEVRPDTVVTFGPDGFTGHTDHQAVSHWTDLALERSTYGAGARLWHAVTQKDLVDQELDGQVRDLRPRSSRGSAPTTSSPCGCRWRAPRWTARWRPCCARPRRPATWSARSAATGSPRGSPPSASPHRS